MGIGTDIENGRFDFNSRKLKNPFLYKMKNDYIFAIHHAKIAYAKTLIDQLQDVGELEIKFSTRPDEEEIDELPKDAKVEPWEIVFFPMKVKGREVSHGVMVPYEDSAVNGNIVIRNRKVVSTSSNHHSLGYEDVVNPVLKFAGDLLGKLLGSLS